MRAHFTTFNQPHGFAALEAETAGFTEVVVAHRAPSVRAGDTLVVYNTPARHLAAVVTVTGPAFERVAGANLERWPYILPTRPEVVSDRGPKFLDVPPGRANPRSIDAELLGRCERIVRNNSRR